MMTKRPTSPRFSSMSARTPAGPNPVARFTATVAGPLRRVQCCVNGITARGECCGHAGRWVDSSGSCFVTERRRQIVGRLDIGGGFYVIESR